MKIKNKILVIVALIFLGIILLWVIVASNKNKQQNPKNSQPITANKSNHNSNHLQGKIYLTLKNKNNNNSGIYYVDLAKKELKNLYTGRSCIVMGGKINQQNSMLVSTNCIADGKQPFRIYADNINKKEKNQKIALGYAAHMEKEATWSSDSKQIAFVELMPKGQQKGKLADIEQWRIFVSDLTGKKQFIGTGIHPFFSPDNKKVLALRKEGVFLFDIAKKTGRSIPLRPIKKISFNTNTSLSLSPKKDKLAIANSATNDLLIYKIDFKKKETMEMVNAVKVIDLKGNHVLASYFHPTDENYLATIETTPKGEINLVLHNLLTKKAETILKLNNYSQFQINDWK